MPVVLVTPEAMRRPEAPYCQLLRDSGFEVRFPHDPAMARQQALPVERRVFVGLVVGGT